MTAVIGSRMVNASGVKYYSTVDNGFIRDVCSAVVGTIGHALVNELVSAMRFWTPFKWAR